LGAGFDLVANGKCKGYTILVGNFIIADQCYSSTLINGRPAWQKKGFNVVEVSTEQEFIARLPWCDVACVYSGSISNWSGCSPQQFRDALKEFHNQGKGIWVWTDNDPLFVHANEFLPQVFGVKILGNTPGGKILSLSNDDSGGDPPVGTFKPHVITTGISRLYEGVTISYPAKKSREEILKYDPGCDFSYAPFKVLATSTDGHPVSLYADSQFLGESCGRILIDCGYTKMYCSWDDAGTARYVVNGVAWLLAKEKKEEGKE